MKAPIPSFTGLASLASASLLTALTFATSTLVSLGHEDLSKPVITTETKKDADGKDVLYMYIDGIKVHETDASKQPLPPVITPGATVGIAAPPSDAIVLFDGSEKALTENWTDTKGNPSGWKVVDGALESVKMAGYIQTKEKFGSCQLHVEWATPTKVEGDGQGRGRVPQAVRCEVRLADRPGGRPEGAPVEVAVTQHPAAGVLEDEVVGTLASDRGGDLFGE